MCFRSFHILIVIFYIDPKENHTNKIRIFSKKWRELFLLAMNDEAPLWTELKVESEVSDFMESISNVFRADNKVHKTLLQGKLNYYIHIAAFLSLCTTSYNFALYRVS
jgi:hypothetical protein